MKICFISRSAYPLFNNECKETFGGAEVDLYLISRELAKDSIFNINFITGDFGQHKTELHENVTVHKCYRFNEIKLKQILKLVWKIIIVRADVYIQEGASGGTGVIAVMCKLMRKKFIYRTASDIDCDGTFINSIKIEGMLYKLGLMLASLIITQNIKNQTQLKENHLLNSVVIRNGILVPSLDIENKNTVLWVGRSENLKQPFIFLEIAQKIPNQKFVMICPKANFNSVNLQTLKIQAQTMSNVNLIDYVPYKDINSYFEHAKVFINTSTYEGFPNTFVQASANSVAIFSLNVNPDNFIVESKCGFFADGDLDSLVQNLMVCLNDQSLLDIMSINSHSFASSNFDISLIISRYKEVIKQVMNV